MPKRLLVFMVLLLSTSWPLGAQVTIDVAKISCFQFATYKIAEPDRIAIWLHGYFHGKRGDLIRNSPETPTKSKNTALRIPTFR